MFCHSIIIIIDYYRCKQSNVRVSEAKYPIREGGDGRSPIVLGRMKRTRSMQPKPFEKKVMRSVGE